MAGTTTICTCIEAGELETQTLLLAESLRRFGGRWAASPMVAVKPRRGPRIAARTRKRLRELNVTLVDEPLNDAIAWWPHANKAAAMRFVERNAATPFVTWMDGDMVILKEPSEFAPPAGADFAARPAESCDVASNGHDDKAVYWRRLCAMFDLDFDAFPAVVSFPERKPIKAYWQTGIYTYRKDAAAGARHYDVLSQMMKTNIASRYSGVYHQDQVSFALAVQSLKLRHSEYSPDMNFNYTMLDKEASGLLPLGDVRILHYHRSLTPAEYGWTRQGLACLQTDRLALIDAYAPSRPPRFSVRLQRKLFDVIRKRKREKFKAKAQQF